MEFAKIKALVAVALIPFLVGCGTSKVAAPKQEIKINIPSTCQSAKAFTAVKSEIKDAEFIDTKWQPAPNTELFDVLNNGGIACSYGIQNAAIGATFRWVNDVENNYEKWSQEWLTQGYKRVDLSKYGLASGYFLVKPQSESQEFHIWNLNFKSGGVWVSISRTSGDDLLVGSKLIEATLAQ